LEVIDKEKIKQGVKLILEGIGVDLNDENFKDTPTRVADFLEELLSPKITEEDYKYFTSKGDLVIVKDVDTYTLCPHHLLPVHYRVYVAYIPKDKVVGVSKLVRAALDEARRLALQEQFTERLAERV